MSYLLSTIKSEQQSEKLNQALCYYINMTEKTQIIRATNQAKCYLECLVFPKERILFTTLPDSHLEVNSFDFNGEVTKEIDCRLLYI